MTGNNARSPMEAAQRLVTKSRPQGKVPDMWTSATKETGIRGTEQTGQDRRLLGQQTRDQEGQAGDQKGQDSQDRQTAGSQTQG